MLLHVLRAYMNIVMLYLAFTEGITVSKSSKMKPEDQKVICSIHSLRQYLEISVHKPSMYCHKRLGKRGCSIEAFPFHIRVQAVNPKY